MAKRGLKQGKVVVVKNRNRKPMENARYCAVRLELTDDAVCALKQSGVYLEIPRNGEVCALMTIHALGTMLLRAKKQPEDVIIPTLLRDLF